MKPITIPHANNEAKQKGMEVPDLGDCQGLDWPVEKDPRRQPATKP